MAKSIIAYDGNKYNVNGCRLSSFIVTEVLNGTNESAYNVLAAFGQMNLIPVFGKTTISEIGRFYGVSDAYLRHVYSKYDLVARKENGDVDHATTWDIIEKLSMTREFNSVSYCKETKTLCILDKRWKDVRIKTPGPYKYNLYSPRVCLATAAMMYFGRKIKNDSIGQKIYETLEKSEYGIRAKKAHDEALEELCAKMKAEETAAASEEVVAVPEEEVLPHPLIVNNDNQSVLITADVFKTLLYMAVKAGIQEALVSMNIPAANQAAALNS